MSNPERKTGWNTYYPWLLALTGTFSVILIFVVVSSWMPSPAIEGVPEYETAPQMFVPGLLGILMVVMAGRQLYLRGQREK